MTKFAPTLSLVLALTVLTGGFANSQDRVVTAETAAQTSSQPPPAKAPAPTVRVQVVLARYNGEKKVASQPYVLLTVANGEGKFLRTGAEVPIIATAVPTKESALGYKSIGTDISCGVSLQDDGRLLTSLTVNASSVYPTDDKAGRPSFRNYRLAGTAFLRDGQTVELASATDSLTGEVIKAEVTLTIVK